MKKLYWRPQRTSARILGFLAVTAAIGMVSVETFRVREVQPHYKEKLAAWPVPHGLARPGGSSNPGGRRSTV